MKPLVIVPTYNEIDSLPVLLAALNEHVDVDVLVVDDNSPDGTGEWAEAERENNSRLHVLHREAKNGLAKAYIAGFRWALERDYSHVVQMDADGSHRAVDLPTLLDRAAEIDQPDLVIGSRWMPGGSVVNWPAHREYLSRGGNLYNRLALGLPYTDITAGYRVYSASALRRINLDDIQVAGYYWQTDMTERFHRAGRLIVEVPIAFYEREAGQSKLSGAIFTESLRETTKRGLARLRRAIRA